MVKMTPKTRKIAKAYAAPFILRLLRPLTGEKLNQAIKTNMKLVDKLKENPEYLKMLRYTCLIIPFVKEGILHKALPNIKSKPWIRWFIKNECKHKRPDFYRIFMYNPNGWKWLVKNLEELYEYLEDNL